MMEWIRSKGCEEFVKKQLKGQREEFLEDLNKLKKECDIRENILLGYEPIKFKWEVEKDEQV